MVKDGFKYAELPGGKLLRFPDNTSDQDIQRAVRKELGLSHGDMMEAFQKVAEEFAAMLEQGKKNQRKDKDLLDGIADSLTASNSRISGEINDALKDIKQALKSYHSDLNKVMT